jgi:hypothetical protein
MAMLRSGPSENVCIKIRGYGEDGFGYTSMSSSFKIGEAVMNLRYYDTIKMLS